MKYLRFINVLFLLKIFTIFALDSSDMDLLSTNPIVYIMEQLKEKGLVSDLILEDNIAREFILRIKQEMSALPYSIRLRAKIETGLLKLLQSTAEEKLNLLEKYSQDPYKVFYYIIESQVDFIDLASLLGITLDESTLSTPEIKEYQRRYFPVLGGSVDNLEEVTENNYHLYNTWYERFLENKAKGIQDIPIPEAKAAFDYLAACIALYKKMFENLAFQEFLERRTVNFNSKFKDNKSNMNFNKHIQEKLDQFQKIIYQDQINDPQKYSYFQLVEIDILWRNLIDSIFLSVDQAIHCQTSIDALEEYSRDETKGFFEEGCFFLPGIGKLNNTVFAINYGVPYLHFYDITLGMFPYDGLIGTNLLARKNHDNRHTLAIKRAFEADNIQNYYKHHNRKWIKIAFIRFLEFCKKFSHEEFITIVPIIVNLIHELDAEHFPIFPNFMSVLLEMQSKENQERFKLTPERIGELNKAWREVWEQLPLKKLEEK
jgi:hypothetical protein